LAKKLNTTGIFLCIGLLSFFKPANSQIQKQIIYSTVKGLTRGEMSSLKGGDFNGDGFEDLVVIAPLYRNGKGELTGCAFIYKGGRDGLGTTQPQLIEGHFAGSSYGIISCTTGDFNDDGYDDLALGNNFYGEPQLDKGYVQVHMGSEKGLQSDPDLLETGRNNYGSFGSRLMTADYNGDGVDDLLVEARFDQLLEGRIYIYSGRGQFDLKKPDHTLVYPGSESLYMCYTLDYNKDGFTDVVCRSNRNWNSHQTEISIFHGGPEPEKKPAQTYRSGMFFPMHYLPGSNEQEMLMTGSMNTKFQTQVTKIAVADNKHMKIHDFHIPGSVFNTAVPKGEPGTFFLYTSVPPLELHQYRVEGDNHSPRLIRSIDLSDKMISQFNGMVFLDANGDGKLELVIAYTAAGREKLVVMEWEKNKKYCGRKI